MRKIFFFTVIICLLSVAAFAQKSDFSGRWTLEVSRSKPDERARIESMTMTVTQTDKELKVETATKRAPRPEGAPGGTGGAGFGRGGGFGGSDAATTYSLDGKETNVEQDSGMGKVPVTLNAKLDGGKLNLSSSRKFSGPNGEISASTKEAWTLSADGKTLTVQRDVESPRGTNSSTLVFVKK